MKRSSFIFGLLALVGVVFTSCEGEIGKAPEISFDNVQNNTVTLGAGINSYVINGTVTSEEGLSKLVIYKVTTTGRSSVQTTESGKMNDNKNYKFQYTATDITAEIVYEIEATDKEDQVVSQRLTIKVTSATVAIDSWSAVLMGGQDNTTKGSFYAAASNTVYKIADAATNSTKVDFCYYFGATNNATLASIDDASSTTVYGAVANFATKRATKFALLTGVDFAAATGASINALADPTASLVKDLAANKVISFKTADGKKGLILVKEITPTTAAGTITIDVKIVK